MFINIKPTLNESIKQLQFNNVLFKMKKNENLFIINKWKKIKAN